MVQAGIVAVTRGVVVLAGAAFTGGTGGIIPAITPGFTAAISGMTDAMRVETSDKSGGRTALTRDVSFSRIVSR